MTKNVFGQKSKKNNITKKGKPSKSCQERESNPGPLAPQSDVLPLGHQAN